MRAPQQNCGPTEFVVLLALLMSLVALATDMVLPALPYLGVALNVTEITDTQLIVSVLFVGLALGQLLWGPLSDSIGRKQAIYIGVGVFAVGCLVSLFANSMETMLVGRSLQGVGAAATRIVSVAIIRDRMAGREMARIMSFVMAVFILVPIVAPMMGQGILYLGDWRLIFIFFLILTAMVVTWFALRLPESLSVERRQPFTAAGFTGGIRAAAANRVTFGYTVAMGLIFGPFLAYLNGSQHVFQEQYGTGDAFVLYFAAGAGTLGLSSILNGRIVRRYGMRRLLNIGQGLQAATSLALLVWMMATGREPDLTLFMAYLVTVFFAVGLLFGNMNSVAMEPQGDNAGAASAFIGFVSTIIGLPVGILIGKLMVDGVAPLVVGFALCAVTSYLAGRSGDGRLRRAPVVRSAKR